MASFNNTFKRIEKKYRLSAEQYDALWPYLDQHMQVDEYGKSTITSLYLDTADYSLICKSLEKPLYKEKLRVRYYGDIRTFGSMSPVFLEIKKKYDGVVYKRRLRLSWAAAEAFLSGADYQQACAAYPLGDERADAESVSAKSLQIAREIEALVHRHETLGFSVAVSCERTACKRRPTASPNKLDDELRVTFDESIRFIDLKGNGTHPTQLLSTNERIMEIKAVGSFPLWLVQALSACEIRPSSFSKYGEAFRIIAAAGAADAADAANAAVAVEALKATEDASFPETARFTVTHRASPANRQRYSQDPRPFVVTRSLIPSYSTRSNHA